MCLLRCYVYSIFQLIASQEGCVFIWSDFAALTYAKCSPEMERIWLTEYIPVRGFAFQERAEHLENKVAVTLAAYHTDSSGSGLGSSPTNFPHSANLIIAPSRLSSRVERANHLSNHGDLSGSELVAGSSPRKGRAGVSVNGSLADFRIGPEHFFVLIRKPAPPRGPQTEGAAPKGIPRES